MSDMHDWSGGDYHGHDTGQPGEHPGADHPVQDPNHALEGTFQQHSHDAPGPIDSSDLASLAPHLEVYAHSPEGASDAWTAILFTGDLSQALAPHDPPDAIEVQAFIDRMLEHLERNAF